MRAYNYIPPKDTYTITFVDEQGNEIPDYKTITYDINESVEGETIETKVERIMNNKEPITDGAPTIYTERKEGVIPEYDIRTDRFDHALDMTDSITKQALLKRKERMEERTKANQKTNTDTKQETTPHTTTGQTGTAETAK